MDQNNQQNTVPNTQNTNPSTDRPVGIIATVIIVIVVLLAGGYLFVNKKKAQAPQEAVTTSPSEISDIEIDLNTIDLENSVELEQLEGEL